MTKPRTWKGWAVLTRKDKPAMKADGTYIVSRSKGEAEVMCLGCERVIPVLITEILPRRRKP